MARPWLLGEVTPGARRKNLGEDEMRRLVLQESNQHTRRKNGVRNYGGPQAQGSASIGERFMFTTSNHLTNVTQGPCG